MIWKNAATLNSTENTEANGSSTSNSHYPSTLVQPALEPGAHCGIQVGLGANAGTTELTKIYDDDRIYELGVEWKLFIRLMMVEKGEMRGSYSKIGQAIRSDHRGAKRHIEALVKKEFIDVQECGGQKLLISLREPYHSLARALALSSELPAAESPMNIDLQANGDPELLRLLTTYNAAKANGQKLTITPEPLVLDFETD